MPASRSRTRAPSNSAATRRPPRKRPAPVPGDGPEDYAGDVSVPVSDVVPSPTGPKVLQLFDERPHPALPPDTLARFPLSDLSDEAIARVADAVLAGLPAALARARMQP